jgi:hypothetical protein
MGAIRKALAGGFSGSGGGDGGDINPSKYPVAYLTSQFKDAIAPHIQIINCQMPRRHWGKIGAHQSILYYQMRHLLWSREAVTDIRKILNGKAKFRDLSEMSVNIENFEKALYEVLQCLDFDSWVKTIQVEQDNLIVLKR